MARVHVLFCLGALALVACDASAPVGPSDSGTGLPDGGASSDASTPPTASPPGSACGCDSECAGTATHPGLCVEGICMHRASAECASAGSSEECPSGSRCWGLTGVAGGICWPDCSAVTCAGTCDADGSCVADASASCNASCSEVCTGDTPPPPGDCPPNSHVSGDSCACDDGFTVNADRTACVPACTVPEDCTGGDVCTDGRCQAPPCTATSCPSGTLCADSGECVVDIGTPPPGPVPTCAAGVGTVPDWRCTGGESVCGEIVAFDPAMGVGYWNYALNGETESNQYRSYIRRDVMMLVKYAAAMVACQAPAWTVGNGGAVGLGDMSEADGAIPGTSIGSPGHPAGTHVNGHDMDIGYFQVGTANNQLRPICEHTTGGADQYHCTAAPTGLDPWRTALFIGHLHASPNLRVIGVDGRVGPLVESALTQLCAGGWVSGAACGSAGPSLAYEVTDMGRGWFRFHHHHLHVSVSAP